VAAHRVKKLSGFKAVYGPIRASDLPAFLGADLRATPEMRRKTFTLWERTVLIPVELVAALKAAAIIAPVLLLLAGLGGDRGFWENACRHGLFAVIALFSAILAGAVLTPLLLPLLPSRAFSIKGGIAGVITAFTLLMGRQPHPTRLANSLEALAWLLLIAAVAAYLGMNFTGASTYTSLSGVKKEMRRALPVQIAAGGVGLALWLASRFIS
jgi:acetyl-CoA decarbonylase/synthase complex subunit gamma